MNTVLPLIGFVVIVLAAFAIIYYVVHHLAGFTSLGRISAGFTIGIATLIDQMNVLPWGTILSQTWTAIVGFTLLAATGVLHVIDIVKAQTFAPAPTPMRARQLDPNAPPAGG